ncbi:MAG: voltage-gated potassium channel [Spirosomataceae bacterium]|jgi:voltage-gated potassium channel
MSEQKKAFAKSEEDNVPTSGWRYQLHEIIYEADTKAGKLFDVILLWLILLSIALVMLESVVEYNVKYGYIYNALEWVITGLFVVEYILRIICVKRPFEYIFSFFGVIDFLSAIPKFLSIFFMGTQVLVALRSLRLLRVFRILKLARYMGESQKLTASLRASRTRISVFLFAILIICVILGTVMYLIEGSENGFTSIPQSVYWAIVTLTTVGYGDIAPHTTIGQFIASIIMILGYAIIAIPTGIITSEMSKDGNQGNAKISTQSCPHCTAEKHRHNARFCYRCGERL